MSAVTSREKGELSAARIGKQDRAVFILIVSAVVLFSQPSFATKSQLINAFLTVALAVLSVVVARNRMPLGRMKASLPIIGLLGLATASIYYSVAKRETLSEVAVFLCIVLVGTTIGNLSSVHQICSAIAWAGFLVLMASIFIAIIMPGIGLQPGDYQAGSLRGMYSHRNILAFTLVVPLAAVAGMNASNQKSRFLLIVSLSLGILATNSSTAVSSAAALVVVVLAFKFLAIFKRGYRLVPSLILVPVVALGVVAIYKYWANILLILGRDSTFTGRSYIWAAVSEVSDREAAFGYGWGAVWSGSWVQRYVSAKVGFGVPHAHSGYLDARIQLGYLGLALIVVIMLVVFVRGTRILLRTGNTSYIFVPACIVVFAIYNVFETRITLPLSIFILVVLASHTLVARPGADRGIHDGVR